MAFGQLVRLGVQEVRTLAYSSIDTTYMGVGTRMDRPIRIFLLQNLTDTALMFSFDGVDDHLPLPENGYILLDITANKTRESGYYLAEGTQIYVKEIDSSPTTGSVYLTTFYGSE